MPTFAFYISFFREYDAMQIFSDKRKTQKLFLARATRENSS